MRIVRNSILNFVYSGLSEGARKSERLQKMFFPKTNGVSHPTLRIRACAEAETMTGAAVFVKFNVYSRSFHAVDSFFYNRGIDNTVIFTYDCKSRRIISCKRRMPCVSHYQHCRFWEFLTSESGDTIGTDIGDHPRTGGAAPQRIVLPANAKRVRICIDK